MAASGRPGRVPYWPWILTVPLPHLRAPDAADPSDPSRLAQDRLAKLAEHAAHVDMVSGAIAQHGFRVAPVAQWLQRQAVRVLEPVDRTLDASEQRRPVRDCPCPRASSLLAHRATLRHAACGHIHGITRTGTSSVRAPISILEVRGHGTGFTFALRKPLRQPLKPLSDGLPSCLLAFVQEIAME